MTDHQAQKAALFLASIGAHFNLHSNLKTLSGKSIRE